MKQVRLLFSLLLGVLVYAVTCEALESESIIGGLPVNSDGLGYVVSLQSPLGYHFCTGSIVGDNHVITAAHCFAKDFKEYGNTGAARDEVYVVAGINNLNQVRNYANDPLVVVRSVLKAYIPADYRDEGPLTDDIAILQLQKPFDLRVNPHLYRLSLPPKGVTYDNQQAIICGFGNTELNPKSSNINSVESGSNPDGILAYGWADVLPYDSNFHRRFPNTPVSYSSQIRAMLVQDGVSKIGVCYGDSGGPLVHEGETLALIGVLSSGAEGCSDASYPAFYTRVSEFLPFIFAALQNKNRLSILTHNYI